MEGRKRVEKKNEKNRNKDNISISETFDIDCWSRNRTPGSLLHPLRGCKMGKSYSEVVFPFVSLLKTSTWPTFQLVDRFQTNAEAVSLLPPPVKGFGDMTTSPPPLQAPVCQCLCTGKNSSLPGLDGHISSFSPDPCQPEPMRQGIQIAPLNCLLGLVNWYLDKQSSHERELFLLVTKFSVSLREWSWRVSS